MLFLMVILTMMIPFEAIAIPLYSLCHQLNMLNTKSALILPAVANGTYILFKNAFEEIPDSLAESARIDGASWLAVFTKIYIPLTKPIMVSAGLLYFSINGSPFVWPLIAANAPGGAGSCTGGLARIPAGKRNSVEIFAALWSP